MQDMFEIVLTYNLKSNSDKKKLNARKLSFARFSQNDLQTRHIIDVIVIIVIC